MDRALFIGGDKRMSHCMDILSSVFETSSLGLGADNAEGRYPIIVLPLPFTRDCETVNAPLCGRRLKLADIPAYAEENAIVLCGMANDRLREFCKENGLLLIDYYNEQLISENAELTAEAAVGELLTSLGRTLSGAEIVITGGGRIARALARTLPFLGAAVTLCARSPQQRSWAERIGCRTCEPSGLSALCDKADALLNTVPFALFSEEDFQRMKQDSVFMELATLPKLPAEVTARYKGEYIYAAGLPGKYKPISAGEAIARAILSELSALKL